MARRYRELGREVMLWADTPLTRGRGGEIEIYQKLWCKQYVEANKKGDGTPESQDKARTSLYDRMYANLDSLDTKAGVVMTLNGLIFALYGIVISQRPAAISPSPYLLIGGLVLVFLAVFCSLFVIRVVWSSSDFLEHKNFQLALDQIVLIRSYRTIAHRLSILFVSSSMIIFFLYALKLLDPRVF
jgi:hypothetical protein